MDILIDKNILLYKDADHEVPMRLQELIEIINDLKHRLVIHPASVKEIEEDRNIGEKNVLLSRINSYSKLQTVLDPADDDTFYEKIGKPENKWDQVDSVLLYCVYKNEVDFFLTEDPGIIKQAEVLNISDRVMNFKKALKHFRNLKQKKIKSGDGPVLCFYKKGDCWYVGEKGKEAPFDGINGFEYIHCLLRNENKLMNSIEIYTSGKILGDNISNDELSMEDKEMGGFDVEKPKSDKFLTAEERKALRNEAKRINEKLENQSLPENIREQYINELDKIEEFLNKHISPPRDSISKVGTVRTNVSKSITAALKRIHTVKIMPLYLNESTLKTGGSCIYHPDENNKPSWILFPEDVF